MDALLDETRWLPRPVLALRDELYAYVFVSSAALPFTIYQAYSDLALKGRGRLVYTLHDFFTDDDCVFGRRYFTNDFNIAVLLHCANSWAFLIALRLAIKAGRTTVAQRRAPTWLTTDACSCSRHFITWAVLRLVVAGKVVVPRTMDALPWCAWLAFMQLLRLLVRATDASLRCTLPPGGAKPSHQARAIALLLASAAGIALSLQLLRTLPRGSAALIASFDAVTAAVVLLCSMGSYYLSNLARNEGRMLRPPAAGGLYGRERYNTGCGMYFWGSGVHQEENHERLRRYESVAHALRCAAAAAPPALFAAHVLLLWLLRGVSLYGMDWIIFRALLRAYKTARAAVAREQLAPAMAQTLEEIGEADPHLHTLCLY